MNTQKTYIPPHLLWQTIFFDIEVARKVERYEDLDERTRKCWDDYITRYDRKEYAELLEKQTGKQSFEAYMWEDQASFLGEFSQIVAFSAASWSPKKKALVCRSWSYKDEDKVLSAAYNPMDVAYDKQKNEGWMVCGHNIGGYDLRMLLQRYLVKMPHAIPYVLQVYDRKPWESNVLDTLQLWNPNFGGRRAGGISLDRMCMAFNIESPKSDISGAEVSRVFHQEQDTKRIATYCAQDVVANAHAFAVLCGEPDAYLQSEVDIQLYHE